MPTHPQRGSVFVPSALCTGQSLRVSLWMGEWPSKGDSLQWPGASMSHWLHVLSSSTDLLPKLYKCAPQARWPSACHKCFPTCHCEPVNPPPPAKKLHPEDQRLKVPPLTVTEELNNVIIYLFCFVFIKLLLGNFQFYISVFRNLWHLGRGISLFQTEENIP